MPLFGGNKRPALSGLTKEEQKRCDALDPEIAARQSGGSTGGDALSAVLTEKAASESRGFIWPLVQGWRPTAKRQYTAEIASSNDAAARDSSQVRARYGARLAY